MLEKCHNNIPVVPGKPLFMIKLRGYLAKKLYEIYYKVSVIVEKQEADLDQALEYMKECLKLCEHVNGILMKALEDGNKDDKWA